MNRKTGQEQNDLDMHWMIETQVELKDFQVISWKNVKRKNNVKMERDVRGERGSMQAMTRDKAIKGYVSIIPKIPVATVSSAEVEWEGLLHFCSSAGVFLQGHTEMMLEETE